MKQVNVPNPPEKRERPALMKGARIYVLCASIAVLALLAYAAYIIAWYTTDPSFDVVVTREASGAYRFDVSPNFVVNSVYHISIVGSNGSLAERQKSGSGAQTLIVPSGLSSNDTVTVECSLQYDRIVPSTTTKTKSLVIR